MHLANVNSTVTIAPLNEKFSVQRFEEKYYTEVMDVFVRAFCDAEPMTRYVNMQYYEFYPFAELVVKKAIKDNLSSIIIEKSTAKVVALALVEDLAQALTPTIPPLTIKFAPIFSLLNELSEDYFKTHPPVKNQIAHLSISAVAKHYRHLALSTHVNFHAMKIAKQQGFQWMMSELTNIFNEKGIIHYLKDYKKRIGSIIYRNFIYHQEKPFINLEGAADAYLWKLPHQIKYKNQ